MKDFNYSITQKVLEEAKDKDNYFNKTGDITYDSNQSLGQHIDSMGTKIGMAAHFKHLEGIPVTLISQGEIMNLDKMAEVASDSVSFYLFAFYDILKRNIGENEQEMPKFEVPSYEFTAFNIGFLITGKANEVIEKLEKEDKENTIKTIQDLTKNAVQDYEERLVFEYKKKLRDEIWFDSMKKELTGEIISSMLMIYYIFDKALESPKYTKLTEIMKEFTRLKKPNVPSES